jgi:iron complex transport system ATP-binding protein
MRVTAGRVLAVLGPNGRGKTTLLKLLAGALSPQEGRVGASAPVAFLPQLVHVQLAYTVLEMVLMGRARHVSLFSTPTRVDERVAWEAIERLGLTALASRRFDQISGGERQLVMFARALATRSTILVLDEPGAGLDLRNQGVVLGWIKRLAGQGLTIVFTTHQPQHAHAVADDALLMFGSTRHVSGPASTTMTEENLSELFGVELRPVRIEVGGQQVTSVVPIWRL